MCCGTRVCMLCTCVILVVIAIGLIFGFGIYKHGFHKLKEMVHDCDPSHVNATLCGRPFLGHGYAAPPSPF